MTVQPTEITYGALYGIGSGYEWRVALTLTPSGQRVEIEGCSEKTVVDPNSISLREMASALTAIADLLGEPPPRHHGR